jgi:hypothetical protein
LYLLLEVTHLPVFHPDVVVWVQKALFDACTFDLLAKSLKYLLILKLINKLSIVDDDLLDENLISFVQLALSWKNGFFVEVSLKLLDLLFHVAVDLGRQLLVEGVCEEIAFSLTLFNELRG